MAEKGTHPLTQDQEEELFWDYIDRCREAHQECGYRRTNCSIEMRRQIDYFLKTQVWEGRLVRTKCGKYAIPK